MFYYEVSVIFSDTYQFPGVADVVGIFTDVPQPVGVPGEGGVDRNGDDLTPQGEAANICEKCFFFYGQLFVFPFVVQVVPVLPAYLRMFCRTAGNPGIFS